MLLREITVCQVGGLHVKAEEIGVLTRGSGLSAREERIDIQAGYSRDLSVFYIFSSSIATGVVQPQFWFNVSSMDPQPQS